MNHITVVELHWYHNLPMLLMSGTNVYPRSSSGCKASSMATFSSAHY